MFNNIVFDVAIGLALIYLLYSLLVTILGEMAATKLGLRERILRIAIERMLNDGYDRKRTNQKARRLARPLRGVLWIKEYIRRYFLIQHADFKKSFAGVFYEYPSIKYLSKLAEEGSAWWANTKPAYITASAFSDTIIHMLADRGTGATNMEKIGFALKMNTYLIQPKTLKNISNLYDNALGDEVVFRQNLNGWFNETMDRCNGWYKRKLQSVLFILGFIVALAFNVDSIQIAKILVRDKDSRNKMVDMGIAIAKDTARYDALLHGDTGFAKNVLDTGYNRLQRDLADADAVIGLGWNSDKLYRDHEVILSKECTLSHIIANKGSLLASEDSVIRHVSFSQLNNRRLLDSFKFMLHKLSNDIIEDNYLSQVSDIGSVAVNKLRKSSDSAKKDLENYTKLQGAVAAALSRDSANLLYHNARRLSVEREIDSLSGEEFTRITAVLAKKEEVTITGLRTYSFSELVKHVFGYSLWRNYCWLGLLITSLMLTLGAPFWFDLLRKLVSIRMAGVKPEEKKENPDERRGPDPDYPADGGKGNINNNQGRQFQPSNAIDEVDEALMNYGDKLLAMTGVTAVYVASVIVSAEGEGKPETTKKKLGINVASDTAEQKVKEFLNGKVPEEFYVIYVSGIPTIRADWYGTPLQNGMILNKSDKNGPGSIGCVLKQNNFYYLLSCWHVLKDNRRYSDNMQENMILDHNKQEIGEVNMISNPIDDLGYDYGLALLSAPSDNALIRDTLGIRRDADIKIVPIQAQENGRRNVRFVDVVMHNTPVVKKGRVFGELGKVNLNYSDKTRSVKDIIIISDDSGGFHKPIDNPGNSGSILFDDNDNMVAMVTFSDDRFTYAHKLSPMMDNHHLTVA